VRKILFLFSLWLAVAFGAAAAEPLSLTLTDGAAVSGDIIKINDDGLMLHLTGDTYATTNVPWSRLSQESLKHLVANPKLKQYVENFIDPDASQRPPKPEIPFYPVKDKLERPAHPSILGGLANSPVGLFIFLLLYAANLYAGFEVAVVRGRPIAPVMGLAAVAPVISQIIFLALPVKVEPTPEEEAAAAADDGTAPKPPEEIEIASSSWKEEEEKKIEAQVFARGKFTFNKRFIETKFAGFIGAAQGEAAKQFTLELATVKERFVVVRITQVGAETVVLDAVQRGAVTVPVADIQEIKLNPRQA
jgi:hypothetical protein